MMNCLPRQVNKECGKHGIKGAEPRRLGKSFFLSWLHAQILNWCNFQIMKLFSAIACLVAGLGPASASSLPPKQRATRGLFARASNATAKTSHTPYYFDQAVIKTSQETFLVSLTIADRPFPQRPTICAARQWNLQTTLLY